jgi:hypothetical protein
MVWPVAVAPPIRSAERGVPQARERAWSALQAKRAALPDARVLFWIRRVAERPAWPEPELSHVAELVPVRQRAEVRSPVPVPDREPALLQALAARDWAASQALAVPPEPAPESPERSAFLPR